MKKYIFFVLFLMGVGLITNAQPKRHKHGVKASCPVCYASGKVEKSFVPPPAGFLTKSGAEPKSDIIVTYSLFPPEAKEAFEYAVSIWESIIESDMPIKMKADWRSMSSNVLASCGPETYYADFKDAPIEGRYYPVAIAEKISKQELNGESRFDIEATFNKNIDWYYGTDGDTPYELYDFVSVVLHEIGHGLGFTGFFFIEEGDLGAYAFYQYGDATSFDILVEKSLGKRLVDTAYYTNLSKELKQALESSVLYAHSPSAMFNNNGYRPRLYAPSVFDDGSSIYHLNDGTYPHGNENSLMTHAVGKGEAIHDPGPLVKGIMEDIGWNSLLVRFDKPKDLEEIRPISFNVEVESGYKLDENTMFVVYSTDGFENHSDSLPLLPTEEFRRFTAELIPEEGTGTISYFVQVGDIKNRLTTKPSYAPRQLYEIRIGPDTEKPVVEHTQIPFFLLMDKPMTITARADDNLGVDTVYVEYSINGVAQEPFGLEHDSATNYSGEFPVPLENLKDGDEVVYKIVARDASAAQNVTRFPDKVGYSFRIEEIYDPVYSYVTDFNQETADFIISDFSVYTEEGFEDGALHSPHPYPSPNEDNQELEFSTFLKYPVIISEKGKMSFDEVVLVEPGEPASKYGDDNFWDYVIVEGSKDYGKTWLALTKGYDSGENITWKENYEQGIPFNSQDSETGGSSEWFVNREILLQQTGNFDAGDTILVRFRLFSDPYARGWGWAIDNLKIQPNVSSRQLTTLSPGHIAVFPNPFNDKVTVRLMPGSVIDEIQIEVYNIFGQRVYSSQARNVAGEYRETIDLRSFESGMYLVKVMENGQQVKSKKLIKN